MPLGIKGLLNPRPRENPSSMRKRKLKIDTTREGNMKDAHGGSPVSGNHPACEQM